MPVLERHGAPATFFLNGASLERPFAFWWERLQRAWDRGELDPGTLEDLMAGEVGPGQPTIKRVSAAIQALPPGRRRELAQELGNHAGPDPSDSGMRAGDVRRLAAAGFEIGFHTLHHDALPGLDDPALSEAMIDGKGGLERAAETPVVAIAYPYGKVDRRVADAARTAGYRWGFTSAAEAVGPGSDRLMLGRHDPGVGTVGDLALELARDVRDWRGETPSRPGPTGELPSAPNLGQDMRVLFVASRHPVPPDRGDKLRNYHLVKGLARHADVTLVCFAAEPTSPIEGVRVRTVPFGALSGGFENLRHPRPDLPMQVRLYLQSAMRRAVDDELRRAPMWSTSTSRAWRHTCRRPARLIVTST